MIINTQTIRTNTVKSFNAFREQVQYKIDKTADKVATDFVSWLISKYAVQKVIAKQFDGSSPMCAVLERAVEDAVDDRRSRTGIDADDVDGLDRYIESALEDHEVDADNINNLDHAIESAITDAFEDRFANAVREAIDMDDLAERVTERLVARMTKR